MDIKFVVQIKNGLFEIICMMMFCVKNKGWLQFLILVFGVYLVIEIELLYVMNDKDVLIVDMCELDDCIKGMIFNFYYIFYIEVVGCMDEFGCVKDGVKWNCSKVKKVYVFCNGLVCL